MLCGWKLTWFRASSTLLLECTPGTMKRWVLSPAEDGDDADDGDDDDDDGGGDDDDDDSSNIKNNVFLFPKICFAKRLKIWRKNRINNRRMKGINVGPRRS